MVIAPETVVSFDYTLTDPDGTVIDTSQGREPMSYLHGASNIIPGLEEQMAGKQTGDEFQVTVPPEKAYGVRDERLVQPVPRAQFPADQQIQVGMQFQARSPEGATAIVRVVGVSDSDVTIDANHPLAGVPLTFAVAIRDVRAATQEEKQHGHAHGAGGHQH